LERLLHAAVPDEIALTDDEVGELLGDAAVRLAAAGVDVHWPKELVRTLTARATIQTTEAPPSSMRSFFGADNPVAIDWQLALGGEPLTEEELHRLAEARRPVVRLRDQWVLVDPALAQKARDRSLKPVTAIDALGVALTGSAEIDGQQVAVTPTGWLMTLRRRIAEPDDGTEPVAQPAELAATLRDYQLRGLRWLDRMTSFGLGG